jgi:NUMOD4 motif-containing protein/HNH endonuclease
MTEEWRPVIDFDGFYSVSSLGRVRSEDRVIVMRNGVRQPRRGMVLKTPPNQDGYPKVSLCRDGRRKDGLVHQMVLAAFVGLRPTPKHEGCHNDGVPTNNRWDNLRWDTMANNQRDRLQHGTHTRGERCGTSRFTAAQVRLIRSLKGKFTNLELAQVFGCSKSGIGLIQCGRSWAHL